MIFGGTFDPPHRGHLEIVQRATKFVQADEVWVVPSKFPPQKGPEADYALRLQWAQETFKSKKQYVSDFEKRATTTQFGIDIFYHLAEKNPKARFYWLLGEDQFEHIQFWKEIDRYGAKLIWLVVPRHRLKAHTLGLLSKRLHQTTLAYQILPSTQTHPASSSEIRKLLRGRKSDLRKALTWLPKAIKDNVRQVYQKQNPRKEQKL